MYTIESLTWVAVVPTDPTHPRDGSVKLQVLSVVYNGSPESEQEHQVYWERMQTAFNVSSYALISSLALSLSLIDPLTVFLVSLNMFSVIFLKGVPWSIPLWGFAVTGIYPSKLTRTS